GLNLVCAGHLFTHHVATISLVMGPSMLPTMEVSGEACIELKWINPENLRRGDLVTYMAPYDTTRPVCKRVIGLPGDVVCADPTGQHAPSTEHVVVPKNHIWTTGDNLPWSTDSRTYGPVPMGLIRGRLYAKCWPVWRVFPNTFEYID
ncbi:signal peptidase I family protein, partial [Epithele typhae]|uniref:signal peptidase I family protein n=1 Tax=Epithele typhae TaxID=378194 RepID=UPI0020089BD1